MADRRNNSQTAEGSQRGLIAHAVLAGLTPLIPVPVVDDLAKNYFRRRLVRRLAEASEQVEPEAERQIEPVGTRLQRSTASVPEDHFRHLRARLNSRLGLPSDDAQVSRERN